ncbi:YlxR family protein [Synechococcus elongatus]|uniref:YlxR family protein n=2 Tax=Synechococcus elongatus TaxID=32046 RepID=A0AAN1UU76_SYNEL|nr:YlxR family protein [Synechococcus elongatus]AZB72372.1 DUF448 domain-containing protein [Synechococcus elongatus PCC 11801]QFZ92063.1 YlxR family protein [Synechococcus elongatus PCC 11802]
MSRLPQGYRRCIACRRLAHRQVFWRVIRLSSTGVIALDHGEGRSAYLCPTADCLNQVRRKNRLGRALRASIPEELFTVLAERLTAATAPSASGEPDG